MNIKTISSCAAGLAAAVALSGCASTAPSGTPQSQLVQKKVAYLTPDTNVIQLNYASYSELDQSARNALRNVYSEVVDVNSAKDAGALQAAGVAYVFRPQFKADFSAPSPYRSPLTVFNTQVDYLVTDPAGTEIARVKANGAGSAAFDEFRYDPGLAARRASTDLTAKLSDEIRRNDRLR